MKFACRFWACKVYKNLFSLWRTRLKLVGSQLKDIGSKRAKLEYFNKWAKAYCSQKVNRVEANIRIQ